MSSIDPRVAQWFRGHLAENERLRAMGLEKADPVSGMPLADQIDDVVAFLFAGEGVKGFRSVDPRSVRGVVPLHASIESDVSIWTDSRLIDVGGTLNASILYPAGRAGDDGRYRVRSYKQVTARDARGRYSRILPVMIEMTNMDIFDDGRSRSQTLLMGTDSPPNTPIVLSRWLAIDSRYERGRLDDDEVFSLWTAAGVQAVEGYTWRVEVGLDGGPSIKLTTDAIGASEAFALRDAPSGRDRRAALVHWVREHWRKTRGGGDTAVRAHLRGATRFNWNGFQCLIRPPRPDCLAAKRKDLINATL